MNALREPQQAVGVEARIAGMTAFARQRRQQSRERLTKAALGLFCDRGYAAVSVDDIAAAAEVSRVTFYRHFRSKAALAIELFAGAAAIGKPRILQIGMNGYGDRAVVVRWLGELFAADRDHRQVLRVFLQVSVDDQGFTQRGHQFIAELISGLGAVIPAFAVDSQKDRRRWLQAWLLLYEILDQSSHAALDSGVASDPLVLDILAERFLDFVSQVPADVADLAGGAV